MSQAMFTYNQEQAVSAGVSSYINETGAYGGQITSAEWVQAQTGTAGIELSFESDNGLKANYLTIYYRKHDGSEIKGGAAMLNAIMGCLKLQELGSVNRDGKYFCQDLENKKVGLILQKVLYTKNDQSEGYKFEIRIPFVHSTGKTLKEQLANTDALAVNKMIQTLTDRDERGQNNQAPSGGNQQSAQQGDELSGW